MKLNHKRWITGIIYASVVVVFFGYFGNMALNEGWLIGLLFFGLWLAIVVLDMIWDYLWNSDYIRAQERVDTKRYLGYVEHVYCDTFYLRLDFNTGVQIEIPVALIEELKDQDDDRSVEHVETTPSGLGLYWPQLDIDIRVTELISRFYGHHEY